MGGSLLPFAGSWEIYDINGVGVTLLVYRECIVLSVNQIAP